MAEIWLDGTEEEEEEKREKKNTRTFQSHLVPEGPIQLNLLLRFVISIYPYAPTYVRTVLLAGQTLPLPVSLTVLLAIENL